MIVLQESGGALEMLKPVICPKCERGRLGNIPEGSEAILSRRGRLPPDKHYCGFQIKCLKCRALWVLTLEPMLGIAGELQMI